MSRNRSSSCSGPGSTSVSSASGALLLRLPPRAQAWPRGPAASCRCQTLQLAYTYRNQTHARWRSCANAYVYAARVGSNADAHARHMYRPAGAHCTARAALNRRSTNTWSTSAPSLDQTPIMLPQSARSTSACLVSADSARRCRCLRVPPRPVPVLSISHRRRRHHRRRRQGATGSMGHCAVGPQGHRWAEWIATPLLVGLC